MRESLGLIEVVGLAPALEIADAIAKVAPVKLREIEYTNGAGEVTIKFTGDTSAVEAAFELGVKLGKEFGCLFAARMIASPDQAVIPMVETPPTYNAILGGHESLGRR